MSELPFTAPNPMQGVERNEAPTQSAAEMNSVVARLTGVRFLAEENDVTKEKQDNRGPESRVYARKAIPPKAEDSVERKMAKGHRMPPKEPDEDQPGVGDYDDEAQPVAAKAKSESVNFSKMTGLKNLAEWRQLAGLSEDAPEQTGQVPTAGAHKTNKLKGGLAGLEGTPMVSLGAQEYGDNGDDEEQTFDHAPGDLTAEEYEEKFVEYLESKGIHADLFNQLIDEAMESGDVEEMEALVAVEEGFKEMLTGIGRRISGSGAAPSEPSEPRVVQVEKDPEKRQKIRLQSMHGVSPGTPNPKAQISKSQLALNRAVGQAKAKLPQVSHVDHEDPFLGEDVMEFECECTEDGEPDVAGYIASQHSKMNGKSKKLKLKKRKLKLKKR